MNYKSKLKTFCPLPWNHISANTSGCGRVCCEGFELLKNDQGKNTLWKETNGLYSYFNSEDYKKIRRQMLNGERPKHCVHCFNQEDHGVKSVRMQYIDGYKSDIEEMTKNTNQDGSIDKPKITYVDMSIGNKCNLKCRMCSPGVSYIIGKDWQKMGIDYDEANCKRILEDKWYASSNTFRILKEALPHIRVIFTAGGEPMIIKEHLKMLEMIIEEGHAGHILLRYNSNQTLIPERIVSLWKYFEKIVFNCSVEASGFVNDYIRYPSKWENLEKNIYFLDKLSTEQTNLEVYIHTTLQAYNIAHIPALLKYLRNSDFKNIWRFPFFIWVKDPQWLTPSLLPKKIRYEMIDGVLESLDENERFFLSYNKSHSGWSRERIKILKSFCEMIKNDDSHEKHLPEFIQKTKQLDKIRNQSVLDILPELKSYFS